MLSAQHTPNLTGVLLAGDFHDFDDLYEALHRIIGGEEERTYVASRIRVLNLCYNLRHAAMGNRNAGFKDHGLGDDQMKFLSLVGPRQNLYLSFETLWPEMLFNVFALNHIIESYKRSTKAHIWDGNIAVVRKFQSVILRLVGETVTEKQFVSFKKWADDNSAFSYMFYEDFYPQYLDYLNESWIKMDREKREKNFNIYAKRLTQTTSDYERQRKQIDEVAKEDGVSPQEIYYETDESLEIIW